MPLTSIISYKPETMLENSFVTTSSEISLFSVANRFIIGQHIEQQILGTRTGVPDWAIGMDEPEALVAVWESCAPSVPDPTWTKLEFLSTRLLVVEGSPNVMVQLSGYPHWVMLFCSSEDLSGGSTS
ncbi:hypothetical protein Fcan01_21952 [Folsomia candida]|uniref:Uncharacterized protein n=1 Tax=Folsomia candida TaxID=158441 RepID=A0A226DDP2_FOLCA|nr:hypothetical protein Fcan01_21952 [Folsomia candida]